MDRPSRLRGAVRRNPTEMPGTERSFAKEMRPGGMGFTGCGKTQHFVISRRAAWRGISLFLGINRREIPRFTRNDKINYFSAAYSARAILACAAFHASSASRRRPAAPVEIGCSLFVAGRCRVFLIVRQNIVRGFRPFPGGASFGFAGSLQAGCSGVLTLIASPPHKVAVCRPCPDIYLHGLVRLPKWAGLHPGQPPRMKHSRN